MTIRIKDDVVHLPDGQKIDLQIIRGACASRPEAVASFNLLAGTLQKLAQPAESSSMPRVLITVSGGIADYIADQGVEVRIYDRDNALEGGVDPVPATWADLAGPSDIPFEGDLEDEDDDDTPEDDLTPVVQAPAVRSPRMR